MCGAYTNAHIHVPLKTSYPNDLPEKAEDEMRLFLLDVASADVDDVTADGGGGIQRQIEILCHLRNVGGGE